MSIMTPDQMRNGPHVDMRGRPLDLQSGLQQAPAPPPQLQRQAVIDQLGSPATPALPGSQAALPGARPADAFSRGGQVKQVPNGSLASTVARTAAGTGAQLAGKILGNTAGGAAMGSGITIGTGMLADKIRTKEDMPTFGGTNAEYLDDMGRRFQGTGGGMAAGAVRGAGYGANPGLVAATGGLSVVGGAAIGAAIAAAKKHAKSAFTDFRVEDAADAIKAQYRKELGREASDDEVMGHLQNVGFDPTGGDRWAGEKSTNYIMDQIRGSDEAKQFATRGAVVDQLGGETHADTSVPADAAYTDGAAPAAAGGGGAGVTEGFDSSKFGKNDPKYVFQRIASGISNTDPDRSAKLLAALKADPSGFFANATLDGDKLHANSTDPIYNGITDFDIQKDEENGGAFHWEPTDGGGSAPAAAGGSAADTVDLGSRTQQPDVLDKDTLAQLRAELERIIAGAPNRDALMAQMDGGNG